MTRKQKEKRNKEITDTYQIGLINSPKKTVIKYLAGTTGLSVRQIRNILKKKGNHEENK